MKLQKRIGRKLNDKEYYKYEVDIPTKDIEKLGWKGGTKLKRTIKGKKLILEPEWKRPGENEDTKDKDGKDSRGE